VKKYRVLLVISFVFLYSAKIKGEVLEFSQISLNKKIFLKSLTIKGNDSLREEEIIKLTEIKPDSKVFVYEITNGIAKIIESGLFKNVSYLFYKEGEEFFLEINIVENEKLGDIEVIDNKLLNLNVLMDIFKKNNVIIGKPISTNYIEKALDDFNMYNQKYGIFTYEIDYKIVKRKDKSLSIINEYEREEAVIVVYIKNIPLIRIGEIKLVGTNIAYDDLLNYIGLKPDIWVDSDLLFFSYKRLRKLGFYREIYFKFIKKNFDSPYYDLIIKVDELDLRELATTITAPKNIGVITSIEYYDISLFDTLQRFRAGAGWELALSRPVFILEYTNPFFWKGIFFDLTLKKEDMIEEIKDTKNNKLIQNYSIKLTSGINLWENIFLYLFQQEDYKISYLVDDKYEKLPDSKRDIEILTSSGMFIVWDNVDDNFFITQGLKLGFESQLFWGKNLSNKIGSIIEFYLPAPMFNLIFAVTNRTYVLLSKKNDSISLSLDKKMRTNVQVIEDIMSGITKATTYFSIEFRFPTNIIESLSFVVFAEAGGAWRDYKSVSIENVLYGFGVGLRLSPRKHYSSFFFQFPAGFYLGYRAGDKKPSIAGPISHRDDYYYINLSAGF